MPTAKELVQEIEKLSPAERVRLIDKVVRDTIRPDVEIEGVWVKEVEARWKAFESGEITMVSYESVMDKYRNQR
ncbi:MAG: addiction module protein [Bacteroidia bacterium]|jgi:putative addiction module component (TIGR02574 family)|nr:addiction module protein [Bacteroidia bacterium]